MVSQGRINSPQLSLLSQYTLERRTYYANELKHYYMDYSYPETTRVGMVIIAGIDYDSAFISLRWHYF